MIKKSVFITGMLALVFLFGSACVFIPVCWRHREHARVRGMTCEYRYSRDYAAYERTFL